MSIIWVHVHFQAVLPCQYWENSTDRAKVLRRVGKCQLTQYDYRRKPSYPFPHTRFWALGIHHNYPPKYKVMTNARPEKIFIKLVWGRPERHFLSIGDPRVRSWLNLQGSGVTKRCTKWTRTLLVRIRKYFDCSVTNYKMKATSELATMLNWHLTLHKTLRVNNHPLNYCHAPPPTGCLNF